MPCRKADDSCTLMLRQQDGWLCVSDVLLASYLCLSVVKAMGHSWCSHLGEFQHYWITNYLLLQGERTMTSLGGMSPDMADSGGR